MRFFSIGICCLISLSLTFSGCATYRLEPVEKAPFLDRLETQAQDNVTVSVAALSDEEAKKIFGVSMAHRGVQPIWLKIQNESDSPYIFNQHSIDPNYYSSAEAAYMNHVRTGKWLIILGALSFVCLPVALGIPAEYINAKITNDRINRIFEKRGIANNIVMPHETISGFVFTPLHEGTRKIDLKLYGEKEEKVFTFFVEIPGLKFDYMKKDFETLYPAGAIKEYDEGELKKVLESVRCCTADRKGKGEGDPLNLILIGELQNLIYAFTSAHWDQAESLGVRSAGRMAKAYIFKKEDRWSPFSTLYFEDRSQDVGFQKARQTINERLHLRLWLAPMRYQGKPVWIGTASRDIGVKLTLKTWNLMTHQIDPNVDDSRDYVLADLVEAGWVSYYGYLRYRDPVKQSKPAKNLLGNPYFTDGLRVIIEVPEKEAEAAKYFHWAFPLLPKTPAPEKSGSQAA
jgi:hypothetical protein